MRKKVVYCVLILIVGYFLFVGNSAAVQAQDTPLKDNLNTTAKQSGLATSDIEETGAKDLQEVVGEYIKIGISLLGVIFLIIVIYGGMMWMTAGGDPETVKKARMVLIQAAIGLGVTLVAYQTTHFIISRISETVK
ncbi:hypothetical protein HZB94_04450 [Candidatus Falkowbacteria bacterium]|nr:hypothetical protein [Candidatus Falkowbacteria bacterium]